MLALFTLPAGLLLPAQPALRAVRPQVAARAAAPKCDATNPLLATTMLTADVTFETIKDTAADLFVYALLASTLILTLYSVYVTLDESNKKAGGWTKPDDDDDYLKSSQATAYSKKNMIYNPATNEWRAKEKSEMPSASSSSSGGGGGGGADGGGNRYEKRIMKKEKQKQKKKR